MSWVDGYTIGQPVRVRYQGSWCNAQVVNIRPGGRSCMVLLLRSGTQQTTNIHDPRNIEPCQDTPPSSTSREQPSFDFG